MKIIIFCLLFSFIGLSQDLLVTRRSTTTTALTYSGERILAGIDRTFEASSIYASDFSGGVDGWVNYIRLTLAGNLDGVWGKDNCLGAVCSSVGSNPRMQKTDFFTVNNTYKITFDYFIPSTSSVNYLKLYSGNYTQALVTAFVPTKAAWTTYSSKVIPTNANFQFVYDTGTLGDSIYLQLFNMSQLSNWKSNGNHSIDSSSIFKQADSYSGKCVSSGAGDSTTNFISLDTLRFTEVVAGESYRFSIIANSQTASTTMYVKIGNNTQTFALTNSFAQYNFDFTANTFSVKKKILIWFDKAATVYIDTASLMRGT